jgi:prepilin-type N-terminal cleavage/methylation domain-containing protein
MRRGLKRAAFTLIELLVVVAIIALLLSILLPSLSGAREQGKRAKCLSNLRSIGLSIHQYANDDPAEQTIPIMRQMIQDVSTIGLTADGGYSLWRTANWFCWGGRSGQKVFKVSAKGGYALAKDMPLDSSGGTPVLRPDYDATERPLNLYIVSGVGIEDQKRMEWFSCPGDTGYPDDARVDDSPQPYNALRPCYDTLGSSYRGSLSSFNFYPGGNKPSKAAFSCGIWGLRLSSLVDTGRVVLAGEPTFFNMIGQDDGGDPNSEVPMMGWHKRKMTDNLLFCDGSTRSTKADKKAEVSQGLLDDLADIVPDKGSFVDRRGPTWRLDPYPVGGAIIWGRKILQDNLFNNPAAMLKYPLRNMQDNLRAE